MTIKIRLENFVTNIINLGPFRIFHNFGPPAIAVIPVIKKIIQQVSDNWGTSVSPATRA